MFTADDMRHCLLQTTQGRSFLYSDGGRRFIQAFEAQFSVQFAADQDAAEDQRLREALQERIRKENARAERQRQAAEAKDRRKDPGLYRAPWSA